MMAAVQKVAKPGSTKSKQGQNWYPMQLTLGNSNKRLRTSESLASGVIRVVGHCLQLIVGKVYCKVTKYCKQIQ